MAFSLTRIISSARSICGSSFFIAPNPYTIRRATEEENLHEISVLVPCMDIVKYLPSEVTIKFSWILKDVSKKIQSFLFKERIVSTCCFTTKDLLHKLPLFFPLWTILSHGVQRAKTHTRKCKSAVDWLGRKMRYIQLLREYQSRPIRKFRGTLGEHIWDCLSGC